MAFNIDDYNRLLDEESRNPSGVEVLFRYLGAEVARLGHALIGVQRAVDERLDRHVDHIDQLERQRVQTQKVVHDLANSAQAQLLERRGQDERLNNVFTELGSVRCRLVELEEVAHTPRAEHALEGKVLELQGELSAYRAEQASINQATGRDLTGILKRLHSTPDKEEVDTLRCRLDAIFLRNANLERRATLHEQVAKAPGPEELDTLRLDLGISDKQIGELQRSLWDLAKQVASHSAALFSNYGKSRLEQEVKLFDARVAVLEKRLGALECSAAPEFKEVLPNAATYTWGSTPSAVLYDPAKLPQWKSLLIRRVANGYMAGTADDQTYTAAFTLDATYVFPTWDACQDFCRQVVEKQR